MKDDLLKLYSTLMLIETRGESTKALAECLKFLEGLIVKSQPQDDRPVEVETGA